MQGFFLCRRIIFVNVWMNRQLLYSFAKVCEIISCYYDPIIIAKING